MTDRGLAALAAALDVVEHEGVMAGDWDRLTGWSSERLSSAILAAEPRLRLADAVPASVLYDGIHEGCDADYRHNHSTAPLVDALTSAEHRLVDALLLVDAAVAPVDAEAKFIHPRHGVAGLRESGPLPPEPGKPPTDTAPVDAERLRNLVTLIRVGFLVTTGGKRVRPDQVGNLTSLLHLILGAKDTEAAVAALAAPSEGSEP